MSETLLALVYMAVEWVLVQTGRAVVAVVTLGQWRGEHLARREGRIFGLAGALSFRRDGQRVITGTGLFFVGLLFYVVLPVVVIWWW
jgi:hypothetical protein